MDTVDMTPADEQREALKAEHRAHLSDEVDEEVDEELRRRSMDPPAFNRVRTIFFAIAATIIALGQFSEAVTLIEAGIVELRSRFTNEVEYDLLSRIHVGNTSGYIQNLLGEPQVSKTITDDVEAQYYYSPKYLLTVFISSQRLIAHTVVPLKDDFTPVVADVGTQPFELQTSVFSAFPANPKTYVVDHSNTASYYLEALDSGKAGLFFQTYLGLVSFADGSVDSNLIELYDKAVYGDTDEELEAQTALREGSRPNLFGRGSLELNLIQKSVLTGAEFANYFGQ